MTVSTLANLTNILTIATWGFDMADWQVGDLALCVSMTPRGLHVFKGLSRLRAGGVYSVQRAYVGEDGSTALVFSEVRSDAPSGGYWSGRFRRIPPLADIEGFEEPRRIPVKEKA